MHLRYEISPNRQRLTVFADTEARAELEEVVSPDSDYAMHEAFDQLIANSEMEWVRPEECGDLTAAPMLGIYETLEPAPVVAERWAFMDYQVVSVLDRLMTTGQAVFTC